MSGKSINAKLFYCTDCTGKLFPHATTAEMEKSIQDWLISCEKREKRIKYVCFIISVFYSHNNSEPYEFMHITNIFLYFRENHRSHEQAEAQRNLNSEEESDEDHELRIKKRKQANVNHNKVNNCTE